MMLSMKRRNMQEYKPDYKKAMELADEVLICSLSTNGFPFSVIELIEEATDIQVHTFNYFRKNMLELKVFGSEDAILFQRDGRAMIAYDEKYPKTRIRFSVLHELGHYMLNHNKVNVPESLYKIQETEANYFAAQILMPEQILGEMRNRLVPLTAEDLQKRFYVSRKAAEIRIDNLDIGISIRANNPGAYDDLIVERFKPFLQKIAPVRSDFYSFEDELELQRERESWC